jgi:NAD(P)-dependent dehydrogenase (short-subunit alcohol dehydrogenase family)
MIPGSLPPGLALVRTEFSLIGEVAIVTGVCGRLGPIWVAALLEAGASVVGIDIHEDAGRTLKDAGLPACAGKYIGIQADVTERSSLYDALAVFLNQVGPPSILVNNAGIDRPPSAEGETWRFEDMPEELSASVLEVNAVGVLRACQVYGPEMVRRRRGSIINIGSLYGIVAPDPRLYAHLESDPPFLKPPAYGMSKAGVGALTRYLAALWGRHGVRVNTLSPGGVLGNQDPLFQQKFTDRVPMGRMATAEDLTGPLLFLASDLSSYVNGTELVVDGGYVCW